MTLAVAVAASAVQLMVRGAWKLFLPGEFERIAKELDEMVDDLSRKVYSSEGKVDDLSRRLGDLPRVKTLSSILAHSSDQLSLT